MIWPDMIEPCQEGPLISKRELLLPFLHYVDLSLSLELQFYPL